MTQGRIWYALQLYQSMLTILVPCNFTPLLWPPCTQLILVSTLGVFIRPQWTVRYPQSFYIFTMQVDLACPLGNMKFLAQGQQKRIRSQNLTLCLAHVHNRELTRCTPRQCKLQKNTIGGVRRWRSWMSQEAGVFYNWRSQEEEIFGGVTPFGWQRFIASGSFRLTHSDIFL